MQHVAWSPLLFSLTLFWIVVHVLYHRFTAKHSRALLPTSLTHTSRNRISLNRVHLSFQTTALNDLHDALVARLRYGSIGRLLRVLYDAGSVLGGIGMVGSIGLLLWTVGWLAMPLTRRARGERTGATIFARRGTEDGSLLTLGVSDNTGLPVQMILPGITVPLSHLPLLLLALLFSQVFHEAGHFFTSAIDALPVSFVGFSLSLLLPSAFVSLPAARTAALPPQARLRLSSSGAFHNLILYGLVIIASPLVATLFSLAYEDVHAWGRVVLSIDPESALTGYLPIGSIITKLDDWNVASAHPSEDLWITYLTHEASPMDDNGLGWCVDQAWFSEQPDSCCHSLQNDSASQTLACFTPYTTPSSSRCIDPLPLFDQQTDSSHSADKMRKRCTTALECGGTYECAWPRADQELLRLTLHIPHLWGGHGQERVIVWSGPRADVLHEVEVGIYLPRAWFLPLGLPSVLVLFASYMQMLNLSLYLMNLLPMHPLDGGQFLDAILDFLGSARPAEDDDGNLEGGEYSGPVDVSRNRRWPGQVQRVIQIVLITLISLCVVLWLSKGLLRM